MDRASFSVSRCVKALSGTGLAVPVAPPALDPAPLPDALEEAAVEVVAAEVDRVVPEEEVLALEPMPVPVLDREDRLPEVAVEDRAEVPTELPVEVVELMLPELSAEVAAALDETPAVPEALSRALPGCGALPEPAPEELLPELDPPAALELPPAGPEDWT